MATKAKRSASAQRESSCRPARLGSLREVAQKFVDALVAEGMNDEPAQSLGRQTYDVGSREGALRELNGGPRRGRYYIALALSRIQNTLDLR